MKLNTFTLTFEAVMFGLITVGSCALQEMKIVCVNVEVILSLHTAASARPPQYVERCDRAVWSC